MMIEYDADITSLTTFRVPATAAAVVRWSNVDELRAVTANESLPRPFKVLGGGSNLLFTAKFGGTLLVRSGAASIQRNESDWTIDVHCELDALCEQVAAAGWRGAENLSGIPGTLGGALVQNAGAYGAETGDFLVSARLYDLQSGELLTVDRQWMRYAYRSSRLKEEPDRYVIIDALMRFLPAETPANLAYGHLHSELGDREATPMAVREAVLKMRNSKLPDPMSVGSAGSFFRNPEVEAEMLQAEMPRFDLGNGLYKVPAAWLIDQCGLKGASVGGASVWVNQPLVIVNAAGSATAADVVALEQKIISAVEAKFSIILTPEVEHL